MKENKIYDTQMLINFQTIQQREIARQKMKATRVFAPKTPIHNSICVGSKYFNHNPEDLVQGVERFVPVFVEKCVTYIEKYAITKEGIYRISPKSTERENIIKRFDEDHNLNFETLQTTGHAVAAALKWFFSDKNMPDPLIPIHLHEELKGAIEMPESTTRICSMRGTYKKLPIANYSTLKFITSHLNKVTQYEASNKMDASNLATCWWPNLFHPRPLSSKPASQQTDLALNEVLRTTIFQDPFIFHSKPEVRWTSHHSLHT